MLLLTLLSLLLSPQHIIHIKNIITNSFYYINLVHSPTTKDYENNNHKALESAIFDEKDLTY